MKAVLKPPPAIRIFRFDGEPGCRVSAAADAVEADRVVARGASNEAVRNSRRSMVCMYTSGSGSGIGIGIGDRDRESGVGTGDTSATLEVNVYERNSRRGRSGASTGWNESPATGGSSILFPARMRQRLHRAIAALSTADPQANRKRRKAEKADGVQARRSGVERRPAFAPCGAGPSSPRRTCFLRPADGRPCREPRRPGGRSRLLRLQGAVLAAPPLLRSALPSPAPTTNFAARTELADLRGRVALLTGGRVKIGYQAGLKLLRSGAHLIVTTRFPRNAAARYAQEPDFADWGRPARDLRPRPAPHAERRGLLPRHGRHPRPARLHHQQRLPDGPAAAGVLRAHDGGGTDRLARATGARPPAARRGVTRTRSPSRPGRAWSRRNCRRCRLLDDELVARTQPLPRRPARRRPAAGRSARHATRGACCWPTCRRSRCSKCSS